MHGVIRIGNLKLLPEKAILIGRTCIISDLHLGFENVVGSYGLTFPRVQIIETINSINKIIEKYKINRLIIAGDLKHEFGKNLPLEWDDVETFLNKFLDLKMEFVRGNHDNFLSIVLAKYCFELKESTKVDKWTVVHGHKECDAKRIIMGHEHPAIKVRINKAIYAYPCFLQVELAEKKIIVLPAFSPLMAGVDVLSTEGFLSPILKGVSPKDIKVYALSGEEVIFLGKIENIKNALLDLSS